MELGYDPGNAQSILDFAIPLTGKTLRDFLTAEEQEKIEENPKNKGDLGNLIERYYFHWNPGNVAGPDFPEAGVELKTTALKRHSKLGYVAKERVKLTSINFMELHKEDWESNSLMKKCATILFIFSLYQSGVAMVDRRFIMEPRLWSFPEKDMDMIRNDWKTIVEKIKDGKAHEISGADTMYLEACTAGSSGQTQMQPFSKEVAKKRAFALKASYINLAVLPDAKYADDIEPVLHKGDKAEDFEKVVLDRLSRFYGKKVDVIEADIAPELTKSKHRYARLAYRMMGVKKNHADEFEKAGIEIKTVNLRKNGTPREDMSFPSFKYMEIVDEEWEDSVYSEKFDKRFLFVIFGKDDEGNKVFKRAMFWNMPPKDLDEARRVWEETKRRIAEGEADNLPLKGFSEVAHIRPHGRDSKLKNRIDTPHNGKQTPKCLWLNALYIKKQIGS